MGPVDGRPDDLVDADTTNRTCLPQWGRSMDGRMTRLSRLPRSWRTARRNGAGR